MSDDTDWKDVRAHLAGDEGAFSRLVERHQCTIATQMRRFSGDPRACEELVQDVFVETYFSLASFRPEAPFLHWLRRIATRVGYRHWRNEKRRARDLPMLDLEVAAGGEEPDPDPDLALRAEAILRDLFSLLRPKERLVLTLLYLEECSTREIAERMGWTRAMVKMRAYRARKKLRALMEERGLAEGWE